MSVYVPHQRSEQRVEGLEEFIATIEKARAERRSYLLGGDLTWYGIKDWRLVKNPDLCDDAMKTVKWKDTPIDRRGRIR